MTKQQMEQLAAKTAHLFGYGLADGEGELNTVASERSGFTYKAGVPPMYMSRTGKKVVRADVNGIGRLVSQAGFFNSAGGYYTFDAGIADAIGGYPYGAILRWKDPDSGHVRIVRSLKPDNSDDFVANPSLIDGESWEFADNNLPVSVRPRVYPLWSLCSPGFSPESAAWLSLGGEPFTAQRPGMMMIQAGFDENEGVSAGNSEVLVWADVRMAGEDDFHSGGMLAYIPPVSNAYGVNSTSSQFVDGIIESKQGYTSQYVAGWVTLWLLPGDSVRIGANVDISFRSRFVFVPLAAKDEINGDSDQTIPEGGANPPEPPGGDDPPDPLPIGPVPVPPNTPVYIGTAPSTYVRPMDPNSRMRFILPQRKDGEARDLELTIDWPYADRIAQLEFADPSGNPVEFVPQDGDESMFLVQGAVSRTNYFRLTEVSPERFMVYRTNAVDAEDAKE